MKTNKKRQTNMMITDDGGLKITLGPEDVTWFRFLQASRATNSLNGGWNSKSHWQKGLNLLGREAAKFIEGWTTNSFATSDPKPREKEFMFGRELSKERGLLNRGPLTIGSDLGEMSENELNTRLFHNDIHGLWGQAIGYEIPLAAESDGQLKMDIFAVGKGKPSLEIVELKQASNRSDSPLMALSEAICYGIQVIRCRDYLLNDAALKEKSVSSEHFKKIRLILAAPDTYWNYWEWNESLVTPMENIIISVNEAFARENAGLFFDEHSVYHLDQALE